MSARTRPLNRRRLLTLLLATPMVLSGTLARQPRINSLQRLVESNAERLAPGIPIGKAYLERFTKERDPVRLLRALERRLEAVSAPSLEGRLALAVREDFARGATVRACDWLLSRTEARLFALVSLHAQVALPSMSQPQRRQSPA